MTKPRDWSTKQTIAFSVVFFTSMIALGIAIAEVIKLLK